MKRYLVTGPGVENGRLYFDGVGAKEQAIDYGRKAAKREPSLQAVIVTEEERPEDVIADGWSGGSFPSRREPGEHAALRDRMVWHSKSWQEQEECVK